MSNMSQNKERALRALRATYGAQTKTSEEAILKPAKTQKTTQTSSSNENQSNKQLQEKGKLVSLEAEIFHLKMDIVSLWSAILDKKIEGTLKRKDIERIYGDFRCNKKHLINQMDITINKDYEFNEIEGSTSEQENNG